MLSKVAKGSGTKRSALTFASNMKLARLQAISKRQKVAVVFLDLPAQESKADDDIGTISNWGGMWKTSDKDKLEDKNASFNVCNQGVINSAYRIGIVSENPDESKFVAGLPDITNYGTATDKYVVDTWLTDWMFTMDGTGFTGKSNNKTVKVVNVLYPKLENGVNYPKLPNGINGTKDKKVTFIDSSAFVFNKNGTLEGGNAILKFDEGFYNKDNGSGAFQSISTAKSETNYFWIKINQYTGKVTTAEGAALP